MRIGFDCLYLDPNYRGGINSYALGLLEGYRKALAGSRHTLTIFATDRNEQLFEKFRDAPGFEVVAFRNYDPLPRKVLRKASLFSTSETAYELVSNAIDGSFAREMDRRCDLIYVPTTILHHFNHRRPTVVSMHDIQQVHYPEYFSRRERLNRRVRFNLTARHVSYIQASSQFIKEDLLAHFGSLKAEQIAVIPEGVVVEEFAGTPRRAAEIREKYGLPERFLFYPAQLWKHKNHLTVLKALDRIKAAGHAGIPLVMTGARYSAADEIFEFIEKSGLKNVHYLGAVPFSDLVELYRMAHFLITAVLYESSSLCVLESAAAGRPILASATPPNVEMGQILKLNLFEPTSDRALADILTRVWNDSGLIAEQIEHNRRHIEHYSWENAARRYLQFFESIFP